jgi:hypothetical protein
MIHLAYDIGVAIQNVLPHGSYVLYVVDNEIITPHGKDLVEGTQSHIRPKAFDGYDGIQSIPYTVVLPHELPIFALIIFL